MPSRTDLKIYQKPLLKDTSVCACMAFQFHWNICFLYFFFQISVHICIFLVFGLTIYQGYIFHTCLFMFFIELYYLVYLERILFFFLVSIQHIFLVFALTVYQGYIFYTCFLISANMFFKEYLDLWMFLETQERF